MTTCSHRCALTSNETFSIGKSKDLENQRCTKETKRRKRECTWRPRREGNGPRTIDSTASGQSSSGAPMPRVKRETNIHAGDAIVCGVRSVRLKTTLPMSPAPGSRPTPEGFMVHMTGDIGRRVTTWAGIGIVHILVLVLFFPFAYPQFH